MALPALIAHKKEGTRFGGPLLCVGASCLLGRFVTRRYSQLMMMVESSIFPLPLSSDSPTETR